MPVKRGVLIDLRKQIHGLYHEKKTWKHRALQAEKRLRKYGY